VVTPTRTLLEHLVPLNSTEILKEKCISETMRWMPLTFWEQQTALPGYSRKERSSLSIKPSKWPLSDQSRTDKPWRKNPVSEDPLHMRQSVHQPIHPSLSPLEYWNRPCGLVVRVSGYRYMGPRFNSQCCQIFWAAVGLEQGPLSLMRKIEELLGRNSSGSSLENQSYDCEDSLCWPCCTLCPQKLALTSPTRGSRLIGKVH
jgi:hypothetical protein